MVSQLWPTVLKQFYSVGSWWCHIYGIMISWSLFLVYFEYYQKISKCAKNYAFLNALICFSPGVHQIWPLFWLLRESNFAFFLRICKLCAFWVQTKNNEFIFSSMLLLSLMLSLRVMVSSYSKHCGNWKSQKKIVNFLINTQFFTRNHKIGDIAR